MDTERVDDLIYDADVVECTRVFSNAMALWYLGAFAVNVIGHISPASGD